jgi:hypothetical protein
MCGMASDIEFNALTTTWKASQARRSQRDHLAPRSKKTPATIARIPTSMIGNVQRSSGFLHRCHVELRTPMSMNSQPSTVT